jgi:hypothetical protein
MGSALAGALACLALALPACVAYRSGREPARAVPAKSATPVKLGVLFRTRRSYRGAEVELPPYIVSGWKEAVLRGYRESGLFAEVREGIIRDADVQATVRIENTVMASRGFTFLSGVTFFLVPSRSADRFELRTTLNDASGAVLATLRSTATVTTWYQIFLLPASAFLSRDAVISDTLYDLTLDTAAQAQRKGAL